MKTLFPLLTGIFFFFVFAWDLENDRDMYTWLHLLSSVIWLGEYFIQRFKNYDKN